MADDGVEANRLPHVADHISLEELVEAHKQLENSLRTEAFNRTFMEQKLSEQLNNLITRLQKQFTHAVDEIKEQLFTISSGSGTSHSNLVHTSLSKLDFPSFDGSNPQAWKMKCNSYFTLMPTITEVERVNMATRYLEGKALSWYQNLDLGDLVLSWNQFLELVSSRFEYRRSFVEVGTGFGDLPDTSIAIPGSMVDEFEPVQQPLGEPLVDNNGKEFEVKELKEEVTWKKIKDYKGNDGDRTQKDEESVGIFSDALHCDDLLNNVKFELLMEKRIALFEATQLLQVAEHDEEIDDDTVVAAVKKLGEFEDDLTSWDPGVSIVAMISCYEQNLMYEKAIDVFLRMCEKGISVDEVVLVSVLVQIASLALRCGNGLLLKGGQETKRSNAILHKFITLAFPKSIGEGLIRLVIFREEIPELLQLEDVIDLVIPRGSNKHTSQIKASTKIPVLGHADGICHVYVDKSANMDMAKQIVVDAKTYYPAACNAMKTLLVHKGLVQTFGIRIGLPTMTVAAIFGLWVDNCFDIFIAKLCETIFTYYKSWAASELLDPSFLFALDIGEKFSVQRMRFTSLLKITRVKLLGRTINLRNLISERLNKIYRENIEFLFDRFESQDICAIVELEKLLEVLQLGSIVFCKIGRILAEGIGQVQEIIYICDFAVGLNRQLNGSVIPSKRPHHMMLEMWNSLGIVGVITAFNFPCADLGWNICISLVCGNSVVWKGAPTTPIITIAMTKIIVGVLEQNNLLGAIYIAFCGGAMARDICIPLVSFTGSSKVELMVQHTVDERYGKCLLKLIGNNTIIVLDDADIELIVHCVLFAALGTAGQWCTTCRRLLLHDSVYNKVLDRLCDIYKQVKVRNPLGKGTLLGPIFGAKRESGMRFKVGEVGVEQIEKRLELKKHTCDGLKCIICTFPSLDPRGRGSSLGGGIVMAQGSGRWIWVNK